MDERSYSLPPEIPETATLQNGGSAQRATIVHGVFEIGVQKVLSHECNNGSEPVTELFWLESVPTDAAAPEKPVFTTPTKSTQGTGADSEKGTPTPATRSPPPPPPGFGSSLGIFAEAEKKVRAMAQGPSLDPVVRELEVHLRGAASS